MPEQYTITGTITLANEADRAGIKVQAFDRHLPSMERRTHVDPQELDSAVTDREERFTISFTDEQFRRGEASEGASPANDSDKIQLLNLQNLGAHKIFLTVGSMLMTRI